MLPEIHFLYPERATGWPQPSMSDTPDTQNSDLRSRFRRRVRHGLHLLREGVQVTHATGRHDKVEITISGYVTFAEGADVERFIRTQHRCGLAQPNVLTAPRGGRGRPYVQRVARKDWLFSGKLRYDAIEQLGRRRVRLQLSINPTRFAAYVRRFNPEQVSDLCGIPEHQLLHRDPARQAALKDASLERWDNVLPSDRWITAATTEWKELVSLYVEAIVCLVAGDFNARAAVLCPDRLLRLELYPPSATIPLLHHAEVGWEFGVDDARLSYARLEQVLKAGAPSYTTDSRYRVREGRTTRSQWISIDLRQGVTLTAYTKLVTRIRMEIRYSSKGEGRTIGQLVHPDLQFREDMPFAQRLEHLRLDGARRLNRILGQLPDLSETEAADDAVEMSRALTEIARLANGEAKLIQLALSQLAADGVIAAKPRSSLYRIAKGLEEIGAVRRMALVERGALHLFASQGGLEVAFRSLCQRIAPSVQTVSVVADGS